MGFNVVGNVSPLIENAAPVTLACEIVTEEPPVFVKVSERFAVPPTCTLPKARLEGFGLSVPGVTPVPVRGMVRGEPGAFDVIVKLAFAAPAAEGANLTVNEVLWPAFNVSGRVRPIKV